MNNPWIDLEYLCVKLRRWIPENKSYAKRHYFDKLVDVLGKVEGKTESIILNEALAQLSELAGVIDTAIYFRKREIKLMEWLHELAEEQPPKIKSLMINGGNKDQRRGKRELRERKAILRRLENDEEMWNSLPTSKSLPDTDWE